MGIKKLHPNKKCNAPFVNNTLRLWNNWLTTLQSSVLINEEKVIFCKIIVAAGKNASLTHAANSNLLILSDQKP